MGCVDGTQIAITSPNIDDPVYPAVAYLNRKGYHSINVQAVSIQIVNFIDFLLNLF